MGHEEKAKAAPREQPKTVAIGPSPSVSLGDVLRYLPDLEELVKDGARAIATGSAEIPVVKLRFPHGVEVDLGPTPVSVKSGG